MKRTNRSLLAALLLAPVLLQPAPAIDSSNPEYLRGTIRKAGNGDPDAQFILGWCYENGEGVPKNISLAAEYYKKAANQGDALAQYNLGVCCENGWGVKKSRSEAIKWYRKAAAQGNEDAQNELRKLGVE